MNPRKANQAIRQQTTATGVRQALRWRRSAFTLVELLTVIAVIGVLASMVLFALFSVQETARAKRTRTQIAKIHELISGRWESYRTRPLPIRIPPGTSPRQAAWIRLMAMRELMRIEMPDRISDLAPGAGNPMYQTYKDFRTLNLPQLNSPLFRAYHRRIQQVLPGKWGDQILDYGVPDLRAATGSGTGMWTPQYEGSECLYMILATIQDGDTNGLDFFRDHETGDVDNDGMPEILDGWGQPIDFIRWAPGFIGNSASTLQFGDRAPTADGDSGQGNGDPFDPLKIDPRWRDNSVTSDPFALFPLIYSMGADGSGGIARHGKIADDETRRFVGRGGSPQKNHFCITRHGVYPNDPYHHHGVTGAIPQGAIINRGRFVDNISNHMLEAR